MGTCSLDVLPHQTSRSITHVAAHLQMDIWRQMVAAQICGAHVRIVLQFTENVKEINLKIVGNFATEELLTSHIISFRLNNKLLVSALETRSPGGGNIQQ